MRILNPAKISFRNLMSAKLRSFLTILGVIIGVASVIVIMAVGQSAQALIVDQIKGVGSNLIAVLPGSSEEEGPPVAAMGINITTLKYDDLQAIVKGNDAPEIENGAGYVSGTAGIEGGGNDVNITMYGVTASYIDVENADVAEGRFITEEEEQNLSKVVVLGSQLAEDLFGKNDPINQKVEIKDQRFLVIGVLKERGTSGFGAAGQDDAAFLPLKTAQKLILGIDHLGYMRLKAKDANSVASAEESIKEILRDRHDIDDPSNDDFSVRDQASALETITGITDALRYFLIVVGSISLIVGGVGIMNIMLIAVNQRIREVGLRKALGAKESDVMAQFLIEAATISFVGGAVGIILGILVSFLISIGVKAIGYDWRFIISLMSVIVAVLISVAIGIVFGIYPARKASRISPMEALRYE